MLKTALPRELNTVKGWEQMQVLVKRRENRDDVLHPAHMAHLGAQLFSRHLLSVELAGTLLLVALVGAISIVIQGRNTNCLAYDHPRRGLGAMAVQSNLARAEKFFQSAM